MTTIETPKPGRGRFWPCLIIGLLSLQVLLCGAGIYAASVTSKEATVEENYYDKAVHWDALHKGKAAPPAGAHRLGSP